MSQREESASKSTDKRNSGSKAGKRHKSVPKKEPKRRSGQLSTDPSTPKAKLQDKLKQAEKTREFRSARTKKPVAEASDAAPTKLDELFESANRHRNWAIPIILVAALGAGVYFGIGTALLVLAGSFLLLVISAFWASVQSLTGEADLNLDEALSLAAPSAELEQKRATLRALKDLEFEHNIGKISDADYKDLSARYRAEAKRLLQQLSNVESDSRKKAERLFKLKLLELDPDARLVLDKASEAELAELPDEARERVDEVLMEAAVEGAKAKARGRKLEREDEGAETDEDEDEDGEHEHADDEDEDGEHEHAEDAGEPSDEEEFVDDPVEHERPVAGPSRGCKVCKQRNPLENTRCNGCNSLLAEADQQLCSACPAVYPDTEDACPVCGVAAPVEQD